MSKNVKNLPGGRETGSYERGGMNSGVSNLLLIITVIANYYFKFIIIIIIIIIIIRVLRDQVTC